MEMRKRLEMQKQEQQMKAMQYGYPQVSLSPWIFNVLRNSYHGAMLFFPQLAKTFIRHSHRPCLLALTQPSLRPMPLSIKFKSHPLSRPLTQYMLQDLEWLNNFPPVHTQPTNHTLVWAFPHSTNLTSISSNLPIRLSRPEFPSKEYLPPQWLVLTPIWVTLLSSSTIPS